MKTKKINPTTGTILDLGYAMEIICTRTEELRKKTLQEQKRKPYKNQFDVVWDKMMQMVDEKYKKRTV
ncbi:hypothetical protein KY314_04965 [Candidatus Woesearchaeota archaeon]|nr:hypothetical protein [Candidatus Woesearchaeota archaeon]